MLPVIATLAAAFAVVISLKYLTKLIAASIIYQSNYRDEPVAISPHEPLHRDPSRAITFDDTVNRLAPGSSPALAPEDDAVSLPHINTMQKRFG